MSPEICAAERYGPHSDIWSLGCIIYELCKQNPPFDAKTHYQLVQKIKQGRVDPLPEVYSPELQSFIRSCLNVNPLRRPDTWTLIQMPVIRLMRKEKEVVELGKVLKEQQSICVQKTKEAEALLVSLEQDKKAHRDEVEAQLRREWEVKARLEIDRQVEMEKAKLLQQYHEEVQRQGAIQAEAKVEALVEARLAAIQAQSQSQEEEQESSSPTTAPITYHSSFSTAGSLGPATDMSSITLDTPGTANSLVPAMRAKRTPFQRARTTNNMIDSPMDVHMASPSPMSIASLSLSPRRAAALNAGINPVNLFHAQAAQQQSQRQRWQPQLLSPMSSDNEIESPSSDDESADCVGDLSSPTRMVRGNPVADPFKARPTMKRQKTAPVKQLGGLNMGGMGAQPAPALFSAHGHLPQPPSPTRLPGRRPFSKAHTGIAAGKMGDGGEDMLKAAVTRNMGGGNFGAQGGMMMAAGGGVAHNVNPHANLAGRTLVELNQGRTAPPVGLVVRESRGDRVGGAMGLEEVARWDPEETPDMPSPFARKGVRMMVR